MSDRFNNLRLCQQRLENFLPFASTRCAGGWMDSSVSFLSSIVLIFICGWFWVSIIRPIWTRWIWPVLRLLFTILNLYVSAWAAPHSYDSRGSGLYWAEFKICKQASQALRDNRSVFETQLILSEGLRVLGGVVPALLWKQKWWFLWRPSGRSLLRGVGTVSGWAQFTRLCWHGLPQPYCHSLAKQHWLRFNLQASHDIMTEQQGLTVSHSVFMATKATSKFTTSAWLTFCFYIFLQSEVFENISAASLC